MSMNATRVVAESYLHFNGNAREAFSFYKDVFGGELSLMTWGESPLPDRPDDPPPEGIMHGRLTFGNSGIMFSDIPDAMYAKPQGFRISISANDAAEARRVFTALAEGGETVMPFQETFWSPGFGMVDDRFGTPWMVNVGVAH